MAIKGYGGFKEKQPVSWHTIRIPSSSLERIDKWGIKSGLSSRSEATRRLIQIGLDIVEERMIANEK